MDFTPDEFTGELRFEQRAGRSAGKDLLDLIENRPRRETLQGQEDLAACLTLDPAQHIEVLLEIAPIDHVTRRPQAGDITS